MKAVYVTEHGGLDALQYGDMPEPVVGPNDIKVRVRACSLNRLDIFTRQGVKGTRMVFDGPHILGGDVAGDVAETGSEVHSVKVGDRVVVNPRLTCGQCQYCIAGESELCTRPGRIGSNTHGGYAEYRQGTGRQRRRNSRRAIVCRGLVPAHCLHAFLDDAHPARKSPGMGDRPRSICLQRRRNGGHSSSEKRHRSYGDRHNQLRQEGRNGEGPRCR